MTISICLCGAAQNLAVEYIFEALPRVNFFFVCVVLIMALPVGRTELCNQI